jgi:hypothetical protein
MRAPSTRLAMLAAAVAVLGCNFYDGRAALRVMPEGTLGAASSLALRVESERDLELEILVDDVPLAGSHRTNADLVLGVTDLLEGRHVLRVRERGGAGAVESGDRELRIDRTAPSASFTPGGGMDYRGTAFTTTVRFTEAIDPASLEVKAFVATLPPGDHVLGVTLSADATQVDVSLPAATFDYGGVHVEVIASDALGNAATHETTFWPREFYAHVAVSPTPANGPVTITVSGDRSPERVELWIRGALVGARQGGSAPWMFDWDAAQAPSGTYPVEVRAPGWITKGTVPSVVVDTDPPVFRSCEPRERRYPFVTPPRPEPFLARTECVIVSFDEPIQRASASVRSGEVALVVDVGSWASGVTACPTDFASWPSPAAITVEVPSVRDALGNATTAPVSCSLPVPLWASYWGAPLTFSEGAIAANEVAGDLGSSDGKSTAELFWISPPSGEGTGLLRKGKAALGGSFAPVGNPLNASPGGTARELVRISGMQAAFIEVAEGFPGQVWMRQWDGTAWKDGSHGIFGPLNRDPSRNATEITAARDYGVALAWLEEAADGRHAIESLFGQRLPTLTAADGTTAVDVAIASSAPRLDPAWFEADGPTLAWVERAADGRTSLRAAVHHDGVWWPAGGALEARHGAAVSEPVLDRLNGWSMLLAWIEDGEVLVRSWTDAATGWSESVRLSSGEGSARALQLAHTGLGTVLGFVESGATGDRVELRALEDEVWNVVPSPNTGDGTAIASFHVGTGGMRFPVTWADADGNVTMRLYNGP